jgi:potassium-transporting ATPase potassium-binding subunit
MWFIPITLLVLTTIFAIPLSKYAAWIMNGEYRAPRLLGWFEKKLDSGPQNWKQYAVALLVFNLVLFLYGMVWGAGCLRLRQYSTASFRS